MPLPADPTSPNDFDFIIGDWRVRHRRLNARLCGCTDWTDFEGQSSTSKTLGGYGNLEDNILDFPEGRVRALALRSYSRESSTWSIWWLDGRFPGRLDTPVTGKFVDGVGLFFADDTLDGKPVKVRFTWHATAAQPRWEQAFSPDGGASWETNWLMEFTPAPR
jgi:hypothetical protein